MRMMKYKLKNKKKPKFFKTQLLELAIFIIPDISDSFQKVYSEFLMQIQQKNTFQILCAL